MDGFQALSIAMAFAFLGSAAINSIIYLFTKYFKGEQ
jgi:hypothetical protein|tara:strand:+ start:437 stop:547 length:111 start_codon:yes stop_codon:yes gene_type:complete